MHFSSLVFFTGIAHLSAEFCGNCFIDVTILTRDSLQHFPWDVLNKKPQFSKHNLRLCTHTHTHTHTHKHTHTHTDLFYHEESFVSQRIVSYCLHWPNILNFQALKRFWAFPFFWIISFRANILILYPLKTPGNLRLWCFQKI